jgi:hypothetical protein
MGMIKGQFLNFMYRCPVPLNGGFEFYNGSMTNKDTNGGSRVLTITAVANGVAEVTQGALQVSLTRPSGYPATSWGGAEDMAARVNVYNSAAHLASGTYGGMKGLRVYARQYSGGNIVNIYGLEVSVDDRGTAYGGQSSSYLVGQIIAVRNNTIVGTACRALWVQDNSQGSFLSRTIAGDSLVYINSAAARATGAITCAIGFAKTGSGSGFTNAFGFASSDGSEGFTVADSAAFNDTAGYITMICGTTTYYIPVYKGIS